MFVGIVFWQNTCKEEHRLATISFQEISTRYYTVIGPFHEATAMGVCPTACSISSRKARFPSFQGQPSVAGSWKPTFSPTMPRPLTQVAKVQGNHLSPSLRPPPNQDGLHGNGRGFYCTIIRQWRWQVGISRESLGVL